MAAGAELHMPGLVERATTPEVTLSAERSAFATEREKAKEAIQYLEIAQTIIADIEKDLEWAIQAKLDTQERWRPYSRPSWKLPGKI